MFNKISKGIVASTFVTYLKSFGRLFIANAIFISFLVIFISVVLQVLSLVVLHQNLDIFNHNHFNYFRVVIFIDVLAALFVSSFIHGVTFGIVYAKIKAAKISWGSLLCMGKRRYLPLLKFRLFLVVVFCFCLIPIVGLNGLSVTPIVGVSGLILGNTNILYSNLMPVYDILFTIVKSYVLLRLFVVEYIILTKGYGPLDSIKESFGLAKDKPKLLFYILMVMTVLQTALNYFVVYLASIFPVAFNILGWIGFMPLGTIMLIPLYQIFAIHYHHRIHSSSKIVQAEALIRYNTH